MGNPIFSTETLKLGQSFQIEKLFLKNYICEHLEMTGYFTSFLHCQQWGIIKWKASKCGKLA